MDQYDNQDATDDVKSRSDRLERMKRPRGMTMMTMRVRSSDADRYVLPPRRTQLRVQGETDLQTSRPPSSCPWENASERLNEICVESSCARRPLTYFFDDEIRDDGTEIYF